jgi:hypothetical protein
MTRDEKIALIVRRCQFASLEPWSIDGDKIVDGSGLVVCFMARDSNGLVDEGDSDFIEHSGRDIRYLLNCISNARRLYLENAELRRQLAIAREAPEDIGLRSVATPPEETARLYSNIATKALAKIDGENAPRPTEDDSQAG